MRLCLFMFVLSKAYLKHVLNWLDGKFCIFAQKQKKTNAIIYRGMCEIVKVSMDGIQRILLEWRSFLLRDSDIFIYWLHGGYEGEYGGGRDSEVVAVAVGGCWCEGTFLNCSGISSISNPASFISPPAAKAAVAKACLCNWLLLTLLTLLMMASWKLIAG